MVQLRRMERNPAGHDATHVPAYSVTRHDTHSLGPTP